MQRLLKDYVAPIIVAVTVGAGSGYVAVRVQLESLTLRISATEARMDKHDALPSHVGAQGEIVRAMTRGVDNSGRIDRLEQRLDRNLAAIDAKLQKITDHLLSR